MIDLVSKSCSHPGCTTRARFGIVGSKKWDFCCKHAKGGVIDLVRKRCSHPGCTTRAGFGMVGSKKAEFCSKHATPGMINTFSRRERFEGLIV